MIVHHKRLLKIIITLIFLSVVAYKVDMRAMASAVRSISIGFYTVSLALVLVNSLVLALKFKILMEPSGIQQTVTTLLRINLICRFYSFFLSSAVGQGLIRWYSSTKNQDNRGKFITVMILERATFLVVICTTVLVLQSLVVSGNRQMLSMAVGPIAWGILAVTLPIVAYLFSVRVNRSANRLLTAVETKCSLKITAGLSRKLDLFGIYLSQPNILIKCTLIAVAWHLLYLLRVYLLAMAIDVPLSLPLISWMASLVLLLQMVPITLNGIGIRESAYAILFGLEGIPSEKGVLLGLLFLSQMLIVSAIGGVLSALDRP
jgi:uncharacterized membrane protein YbhN (UPF0104 family)